jgi:type I restriction enzyme S subunit
MSNILTKDKTSTKEGYKKTKLGWIPEGWETPEISDVFNFLRTSSFSRNQLNYKEESEIYYIHYGDIHATYKTPILDFEKIQTVPRLNDDVTLPANVHYLKDGDVIIADASEDYEGIGTAIELQNTNKKKVISGLHTFALRDREGKTVQGFRTYIFKNPLVKKALKTIATGSKVFGISKSNVQKFKIVLPPFTEQQKIAQILSTWDKAIALQDQLIKQKQALKKGLMQDLLTGKKRFPGFEEEWEEVRIKEIANTFSGGTPSSKRKEYYDGDIHWLKSGELNKGIIQNTEGYISELGLKNSSAKLVEANTILIAMYGATAGVCAITKIQGAINQAVLALVLNLEIDMFFTYQLLKMKMPNIVHRMVQGGQPNLSGGIINSVKIKLPKLKEQQKIASVLSNFDTDIKKLITHKKSLIQQKQGLMQQLLSGEKRVKILKR